MFNRIGALGVAFVWTVMTGVAVADMLPDSAPDFPLPTGPAVAHPLAIRVDPSQEVSLLVIPKSFLAEGAALPALPPSLVPASAPAAAADPRSRTVVAGVALSAVLAGTFLAFAFVRRRRMKRAVVATVLAMVSISLAVGTAVGDIPPFGGRAKPPRPPIVESPPTDQPPGSGYPGALLPTGAAPAQVNSKVVIQIVDSAEQVVLIFGRDMLTQAK